MSFYKPCTVLFEIGAKTYFSTIPKNFGTLANGHRFIKNKFLIPDKWQRCRGFRERRSGLTPQTPAPQTEHISMSMKSLVKPFLFTVGFSTSTYVGCTIWQYENIRSQSKSSRNGSFFPDSWFPERVKRGGLRQECNELWNKLSEAEKIFAPVLFANVLVFAAWRLPRFQPAMMTYFASNPAARVICWPMLLSTFSHYSFFHLAANMYVLHSFSPAVINSLGKEQAAALYLSAGVIASFTSILHKVLTAQAGLSIGASGAIMGMLGYVCTQYPDVKLAIILLPMFTFTAGAAIKFVLTFDALGVALGWRFFDHAAHLGGALTGIAYAHFGNEFIWKKRGAILEKWHTFRSAQG